MTAPGPSLATGRFFSTAAHYRTGRPAYAPALIRRVAQLSRLRPDSRVLDLGCGPGLLAAAFAPLATEIVAMDPEPEMLAEVEALSLPNLHPRRGSSADLGPALGRFRLVTMGRSFHWMDRAETLRCLDALLEPGGAVALFVTSNPELAANAWVADFKAVRRHYADDDHLHGVRHEDVLLNSPFGHVEAVAVVERRRVPLASLVDRGLSMSATSPARLGARSADFAREIEAAMAPHARDGQIEEIVESRAMVAFRPGEQPD